MGRRIIVSLEQLSARLSKTDSRARTKQRRHCRGVVAEQPTHSGIDTVPLLLR
jgi:hypothetical protein